jgi:GT2 family glycosyltransferase
VTVVMVAYGAESWLERAVDAVLASSGVDVEVVLVDNGCTDGGVDRVRGRPDLKVIEPGENLGFAGGCNEGVRHGRGALVAFVNLDAIVAPDALRRLADVALRPGVGIASASVRLANAPDRLNSAGNEVHFTGFSWSGCFDEPAAAQAVERDALAASGAAMAMRRELWDELGGFDESFFAYYEDAELSLRCWQRGLSVRYVPTAIVNHRYEFSRHPRKLYLAERNRLLMVATCFGPRLLWCVAPALVAVELAMTATAFAQGWGGQKVAGWRWLVQHRHEIAARRRAVQAARAVDDHALVEHFAEHLDPGNAPPPAWARPFDRVLRAYWLAARHLV